jgi:hypothetical protein
MAGLNEDAQWIVMIGFIVSISIFFLALIVNESALVGQTTSEGVLDFPKTDIQDMRYEILYLKNETPSVKDSTQDDMRVLSLERKSAIIWYDHETVLGGGMRSEFIYLHYNNGITAYNETYEENYVEV